MSAGIPVRLSEQLAARARAAATTQDRSLTEQVEHWARLGQAVEDAVMATTVQRLKRRSHDPDLAARIDASKQPAGRARAIALIASRSPVRYGTDSAGQVRTVRANPRRSR